MQGSKKKKAFIGVNIAYRDATNMNPGIVEIVVDPVGPGPNHIRIILSFTIIVIVGCWLAGRRAAGWTRQKNNNLELIYSRR